LSLLSTARTRYQVSVPWRGLRSFGPAGSARWCDRLLSFRPLAGITVFRTS